jgi:hypothetical protein
MEPLLVSVAKESDRVLGYLLDSCSLLNGYIQAWGGSIATLVTLTFLAFALLSFLYTGPAGIIELIAGALFNQIELKAIGLEDFKTALQRTLVFTGIAAAYLGGFWLVLFLAKAGSIEFAGMQTLFGMVASVIVPGLAAMLLHRNGQVRLAQQTSQVFNAIGWLWMVILGLTFGREALQGMTKEHWMAFLGLMAFIALVMRLHIRTRVAALAKADE